MLPANGETAHSRSFGEDHDLAGSIYVHRAQLAYEAGDRKAALRDYRQVCESFATSRSYGIAQFNVGTILKEQGKYAEAIDEFEKLFTSSVNDLDPGSHLMETYRNYRPRAQWEIAHCYRALGKYREALRAYVDTEEKFPFQSWCGNGIAEYAYQYALHQGLCHEFLGNHYTAAVKYWGQLAEGSSLYHDSTISLRLLDLYQRTGNAEALHTMLEEIEARWQRRMSKCRAD